MKEVLDAVSARVKAPYFGYALLAFIGLNWRGLFLLAMTEGSPKDRLAEFDGQTSTWSLLILPFLVAALVMLASPWIRLLFGYTSKFALEYIDNLALDAEHKKTIRKTELERSRADLFASKESELIDRALRDEKVLGIEDEQVKQKLQSEIDSLRRERDKLSLRTDDEISIPRLSETEKEIVKTAARDEESRIIRSIHLNGRSIQIGDRQFGEKSSREFTRYDSALKSLVSKGLVAPMGTGGQMFELTHAGWEIADSL